MSLTRVEIIQGLQGNNSGGSKWEEIVNSTSIKCNIRVSISLVDKKITIKG